MSLSPQQYYLKYIHKETGYRATWDPGRELRIGDVGKLQPDGSFSVHTSLEKEGIKAEVRGDHSAADMDYTSGSKVSIDVKLKGSVPAAGSVFSQVDAGFDIGFSSDKAIVFKASGFKTLQIVNLAAITDAILDKYKNGTWKKDWHVITNLVQADAATIIISTSSSGRLELKANADIGAGAGLKITDANLGLTTVSEKGSNIKFIAQQGLTPLYNIMGIHEPWFNWFGEPTLEVKEEQDKAPALRRYDFNEKAELPEGE
ncbi:hypothetical protein [Chitinophaga solisilvae]|uniref:hypothetical protein n=1 Tax=Chitinophaga solisilvae TaxID=1233460 RepID=UPI00137072AD|nr:hypothetical protein [Chitinophaga solisilvae]